MFRKFKNKHTLQKAASLQIGLLLFVFLISASGCGPKYTYPADKVPQSIEDICKRENNIEVKARVIGKTAAALFYRDGELDPKQPMSKEINEAIGKVMQAVTRVSLSTDLPLDYCATYLRDRVNGTEVSLTRSIDDTKRAYADAIGVEESIKRTVINQAKVRPGADAFVIPEVTQEIFLAQQIAQRARFSFAQNPRKSDEEAETMAVLVEGSFRQISGGNRIFHFSIVSLKAEENPHDTLIAVLKSAVEVFKIYKFENYNEVQMEDFLNRQKLVLDRQTVQDYIDKNISEEELLDKYLMETFYPQNSIRLFGMDLSTQDLTEAPNAPAAASANAQ